MTFTERLIEEGKEEGIKEGKEEGIKEGKEEGIKEGKEEGIEEGEARGILKMAEKGHMSFKIAKAEFEAFRSRIQDKNFWTEIDGKLATLANA